MIRSLRTRTTKGGGSGGRVPSIEVQQQEEGVETQRVGLSRSVHEAGEGRREASGGIQRGRHRRVEGRQSLTRCEVEAPTPCRTGGYTATGLLRQGFGLTF